MPKENITFAKTLNELEKTCDEYIAELWRFNKQIKNISWKQKRFFEKKKIHLEKKT